MIDENQEGLETESGNGSGEESAEGRENGGAKKPIEPIEPKQLERILEGLLFAAREPLPPNRLAAAIAGASTRQVRAALKRMEERLRRSRRAYELEEVAGGYRLVTVPDLAPYVRKLHRIRTQDRLSPAALETLAIVAYRQPVIRADIEAIRGVACGGTLKLLLERGLLRVTGRADVLGHPLLYGTTKVFLEQFGINDLKDLPRTDEFKASST
jgi:segregation and condensation protein B